MKFINIFLGFLKVGMTTFGGGPAAIPIIREEAVDNFQWLTEAEFIDTLAFANTLPGPLVTKLAAFTGYKVGGWLGGTLAIIATVLPSAVLMIMMLGVYQRYRETPWMKNMLVFVKPVIFMLILDVCVGMRGIFSSTNYQAFVIALCTAVGLYVFKLHPAVLILTSISAGVLMAR